ncbi:hypothetical protein SAMD00019534_015800 [Acytostelium subglobosum LB1]|uniref:hypothetical protein n=1 Tax=Acytostelium subglobosum LB1 TaxID=1410327 RepID=UPI000644A9D9|nr:hypothetical protein SAMD00019534_015800 [Acytostelium subglobosum LB1]GAM18405.1 hypothetical protein SAMD00019534_015800 [Acytostelium subglobosum LB1]|eukprot:XP_012757625.1 hypothetical protein SAMD00019534_015800 [Acytostelium subglobosum LB1]
MCCKSFTSPRVNVRLTSNQRFRVPIGDIEAKKIVQQLTDLYASDRERKQKKRELSSKLQYDIYKNQYQLRGNKIQLKKLESTQKKLNKQQQQTNGDGDGDEDIAKQMKSIQSTIDDNRTIMTTLLVDKKRKMSELDEELVISDQSVDHLIITGVNAITKAMEKDESVRPTLRLLIICLPSNNAAGNLMIDHLPFMASMRNIPYVLMPNSFTIEINAALSLKSALGIAIKEDKTSKPNKLIESLVQMGVETWKSTQKIEYPFAGSSLSQAAAPAIELKPTKIIKEGNKRLRV